MSRRLFLAASVLLLLAAGCAAPRSGPAVATPDMVGQSRPQYPVPRAGQADSDLGGSSSAAMTPAGLAAVPRLPSLPRPRPSIVKTSPALQCVPYARGLSKIALRGDAWTWWQGAQGRYARGSAPQPGAVLVLSKTRRLRGGHLAVVVEVVNSREIIVHHANWLNHGRIHRYSPVRDVSPDNDWSLLRLWYTPGQVYGSRQYPAYGFIYPDADELPEQRHAGR